MEEEGGRKWKQTKSKRNKDLNHPLFGQRRQKKKLLKTQESKDKKSIDLKSRKLTPKSSERSSSSRNRGRLQTKELQEPRAPSIQLRYFLFLSLPLTCDIALNWTV